MVRAWKFVSGYVLAWIVLLYLDWWMSCLWLSCRKVATPLASLLGVREKARVHASHNPLLESYFRSTTKHPTQVSTHKHTHTHPQINIKTYSDAYRVCILCYSTRIALPCERQRNNNLLIATYSSKYIHLLNPVSIVIYCYPMLTWFCPLTPYTHSSPSVPYSALCGPRMHWRV